MTEIREEIRDLRQATVSSFNAMREDLTDLRQQMNNGFVEMRGRFDAVAAGQLQIADLLGTVIARQRDDQREH